MLLIVDDVPRGAADDCRDQGVDQRETARAHRARFAPDGRGRVGPRPAAGAAFRHVPEQVANLHFAIEPRRPVPGRPRRHPRQDRIAELTPEERRDASHEPLRR